MIVLSPRDMEVPDMTPAPAVTVVNNSITMPNPQLYPLFTMFAIPCRLNLSCSAPQKPKIP